MLLFCRTFCRYLLGPVVYNVSVLYFLLLFWIILFIMERDILKAVLLVSCLEFLLKNDQLLFTFFGLVRHSFDIFNIFRHGFFKYIYKSWGKIFKFNFWIFSKLFLLTASFLVHGPYFTVFCFGSFCFFVDVINCFVGN